MFFCCNIFISKVLFFLSFSTHFLSPVRPLSWADTMDLVDEGRESYELDFDLVPPINFIFKKNLNEEDFLSENSPDKEELFSTGGSDEDVSLGGSFDCSSVLGHEEDDFLPKNFLTDKFDCFVRGKIMEKFCNFQSELDPNIFDSRLQWGVRASCVLFSVNRWNFSVGLISRVSPKGGDFLRTHHKELYLNSSFLTGWRAVHDKHLFRLIKNAVSAGTLSVLPIVLHELLVSVLVRDSCEIYYNRFDRELFSYLEENGRLPDDVDRCFSVDFIKNIHQISRSSCLGVRERRIVNSLLGRESFFAAYYDLLTEQDYLQLKRALPVLKNWFVGMSSVWVWPHNESFFKLLSLHGHTDRFLRGAFCTLCPYIGIPSKRLCDTLLSYNLFALVGVVHSLLSSQPDPRRVALLQKVDIGCFVRSAFD